MAHGHLNELMQQGLLEAACLHQISRSEIAVMMRLDLMKLFVRKKAKSRIQEKNSRDAPRRSDEHRYRRENLSEIMSGRLKN